MPPTTYIDAAVERVDTERGAAAAKLSAIESFVDRVESISPASSRVQAPSVAGSGGVARQTDASGSRGCESVRNAFAETVHPHTATDATESPDGSVSLQAAIRGEFTESIAVALAPASDVSFSPRVKQAVLTAARNRRSELTVLCRTLDRERASLRVGAEAVDAISAWITAADETPLTEFGFDALRGRHETLAAHRERCDEVAADRQSFLAATTGHEGEAGLRHRDLAASLYGGLAVDHPVLTTVARLDDACQECQRAVRAHLVRRA